MWSQILLLLQSIRNLDQGSDRRRLEHIPKDKMEESVLMCARSFTLLDWPCLNVVTEDRKTIILTPT